jgi:hypothetical protein
VSGFLQRLAAAAISPARAIHPIVGSVYSSSDNPLGAVGLQSASTVIAPSPVAAPAGATAEVSLSPSVNPPRFELLAPTSPTHRQGKPTSGVPPNPAMGNEAELKRGLAEHHAAEPSAVERSETAGTRPQPLLIPRILEKAPNSLRGPPERRAGLPVTSRPATRAAMRAEPPREPDEIQIHIGRIEVTAIPPPAAPRAVKTPRHGLNLDAYLKRGERTSR